MKALGPILLILIVYSVTMTWIAVALWYRIKSSKDPLQVLPKKDRVNFARELLDRQQEEYQDARQERLAEQVRGFSALDRPTHKESA